MKLFTVAGELSGDAHGGPLLEGLRKRLPDLQISGIGGPRMLAAGLEPLFSLDDLQVHGLLEVLAHLPRLYRILWRLEAELREQRPDAVLLIDYPGFNLKVARAAKALGIPVFYYSSPQVWAWRKGRIRTVAETVRLMVVLFPFEAALYEKVGVEAAFLGHPLVGMQAEAGQVKALRGRIHADTEAEAGQPVVALMPGSRPSELRRNLPVLLQAVRRIAASGYAGRFVIPVAPSLELAEVRAMIDTANAEGTAQADAGNGALPVQALEGAFLPLLQVADLAIVASGTATLQTAMAGVPFLVVYRMTRLTWELARRVAYQQFLCIVNILAGREVVPELIQHRFTAEGVSEAFLALANDPARRETMRSELAAIAATLGEPGAYERAADLLAGRLEGLQAAQSS